MDNQELWFQGFNQGQGTEEFLMENIKLFCFPNWQKIFLPSGMNVCTEEPRNGGEEFNNNLNLKTIKNQSEIVAYREKVLSGMLSGMLI